MRSLATWSVSEIEHQVNLMKFNDGKITIKGKVASVERIIKSLKKNKRYDKISIDSPVMRLSHGKYESMNISFVVSNDN